MAASEAAPYAKTGGLADVIEALPKALAARGHQVAVLIPGYRRAPLDGARRAADFTVRVGARAYDFSIRTLADAPVAVFAADCPVLFDRKHLYGPPDGEYPDNHIRFAAFSQAALSVARHLFRPEVLHCHDWQSAMAIAYLRHHFQRDPLLLGVRTLFTIHNLGYQGRYGAAAFGDLGLDAGLFRPEGLEFFGGVNLLKGGILWADRINTVSPTYAREIQRPEHGFGLDGLLRARAGALSGILNGVDYETWDPARDPLIAARYSPADLSGKRACKRDLLAAMGLSAENAGLPLAGVVSRLTKQKGLDLLLAARESLIASDLRLVVLGAGDAEYMKGFQSLADDYPDRFAVRFGFDERLAHKIEAGSDMFLMPSRYEPCGLNQMYSLRYGTVPVVRATGGLEDTVDSATGFKFHEESGEALWSAIAAAMEMYRRPGEWRAMMLAGMGKDFSWAVSAAAYEELYRALGGG
jgi:starch synthase